MSERDEFWALADEVALRCMVMDMTEMMKPANEARRIAEAHRDQKTQQWYRAQNAAAQAIIALQEMGKLP